MERCAGKITNRAEPSCTPTAGTLRKKPSTDLCKTARTLKRNGNSEARYPKYRRGFRTTIWKNTGIGKPGSTLLLALPWPGSAHGVDPDRWGVLFVLEARLVFDKKSYKYTWHMVLDDGQVPPAAPGDRVLVVDMGEIHPAVVADTEQARWSPAEPCGRASSTGISGDRSWPPCGTKDGGRRTSTHPETDESVQGPAGTTGTGHLAQGFAARWSIMRWARRAGNFVIGDVRDVAEGVALGKRKNQKVSGWSHGRCGSTLVQGRACRDRSRVARRGLHDQTCPVCGQRKKPSGRIYRCEACGGVFHRDVVRAVNILSAHVYGEPGQYRHRHESIAGRSKDARSGVDTPDLARGLS